VYVFIDRHASEYPVQVMCRVLGVSRSGFYAYRARGRRPESVRAREDRHLAVAIKAIHQASRQTYGAPRILDDLREQGFSPSRKRVQRLMREAGVRGSRRRRFTVTTDSAHEHRVAENLLARDFSASSVNQKWACDITYIATAQGWLYLAVVLDLYSRRIVGHAMSASLEAGLTQTALARAQARRRPSRGLLHHSDRGSQYASTSYQEQLLAAGFVCSMSRRGDCWDNAPVESFFATLKTELIARRRYRSRAEASSDIEAYIELFYNLRRKHSTLGYLSPAAFEVKHHASARKAE
jgi:putative transposase